jgi:hypothetical protein
LPIFAEKQKVAVVVDAVSKKAAEIGAVKDDAESDLSAAKPALDEALAALNSITQKDIVSLKALKSPPDIVKRIFDAVLLLRYWPIDKVREGSLVSMVCRLARCASAYLSYGAAGPMAARCIACTQHSCAAACLWTGDTTERVQGYATDASYSALSPAAVAAVHTHAVTICRSPGRRTRAPWSWLAAMTPA